MVEIISNPKTILVFKTNITEALENEVRNVLSRFDKIFKINFDFEDCDNILRIEAESDISTIIEKTLNSNGYFCQELSY